MAFQIEPLHRCINGSITHSERRGHFKKIWSSSSLMRVLQVFHGLARWHGLAGKINEVGAGSFRPQCRPCKSSRSWTLSSLSRLVSQVRQQTHECDEFQRKDSSFMSFRIGDFALKTVSISVVPSLSSTPPFNRTSAFGALTASSTAFE